MHISGQKFNNQRAFQHIHESIVSEPTLTKTVLFKEVPLITPQEPITFIRKYITTKTTTQQIPPCSQMAPTVHEQFLIQQQYQQQQQQHQFGAVDHLQNENLNAQQRFRCSSTQQQLTQEQLNNQSFRSASIPPAQRCQDESQFSTTSNILNSSTLSNAGLANGATTSRYFSSRKTTNTEQQQQQNIPLINIRDIKTSNHHHINNSSYMPQNIEKQTLTHQKGQKSAPITNTAQTLPVNYSQTNSKENNCQTNRSCESTAGVESTSCIDFTNSRCNIDWRIKNGKIKKSLPNTSHSNIIPILQFQ